MVKKKRPDLLWLLTNKVSNYHYEPASEVVGFKNDVALNVVKLVILTLHVVILLISIIKALKKPLQAA